MFRALLMKESVKLRFALLLALLVHGAVLVLLGLEVRRAFLMDHAETVWYNLLVLRQIPYGQLRYLPLATGLFVAAWQYGPETAGGKLRLSLHLPCPTWAMVFFHLGVGALVLTLFSLLDGLVLSCLLSAHYPREVVWGAWCVFLPWACAGLAAYMALAGAYLEPRRVFKVFYLCLGLGAGALLTLRVNPGAGWPLTALGLLLVLLLAFGALEAAYRFRLRRVA